MKENRTYKKSGNPTQPGHRSNTSRTKGNRKQLNIIQQFALFFKSLTVKERILLPLLIVLTPAAILWRKFVAYFKSLDTESRARLVALIVALIALASLSLYVVFNDIPEEKPEQPAQTEQPAEYIFRDGTGTPVDLQAMTDAWAAEGGFEKRYNLTDAERWEVASVVTAEAMGEPYCGKVAVAQCILQACEDSGYRPSTVVEIYDYSYHRPVPSEEALDAVQDVFDFGHMATTEPIKYFYAPARTTSEWHETQDYVMTINGHKFFKEATK